MQDLAALDALEATHFATKNKSAAQQCPAPGNGPPCWKGHSALTNDTSQLYSAGSLAALPGPAAHGHVWRGGSAPQQALHQPPAGGTTHRPQQGHHTPALPPAACKQALWGSAAGGAPPTHDGAHWDHNGGVGVPHNAVEAGAAAASAAQHAQQPWRYGGGEQHTTAAAKQGPSNGWPGSRSAGSAPACASAAQPHAGTCHGQPGTAVLQAQSLQEPDPQQAEAAQGGRAWVCLDDWNCMHDWVDVHEEPDLRDYSDDAAAARPSSGGCADRPELEDEDPAAAASGGPAAPRLVECSTANKGILVDRWCSPNPLSASLTSFPGLCAVPWAPCGACLRTPVAVTPLHVTATRQQQAAAMRDLARSGAGGNLVGLLVLVVIQACCTLLPRFIVL